ncbi:MAG: hypothetical protein M3Q03_12830 [Chloroflexota bacterium]|nr:hypothetical protein [Chloroflexota bacterium]
MRTNLTGTAPDLYRFDLTTLDKPANLRVLRALFTDPATLVGRGEEPRRAAHFLVQLLFCLFAEDAGLPPRGLFSDLLAYCARYLEEFPAQVGRLLGAMRDGGAVAYRRVERFNGGLFVEIDSVPITRQEIEGLAAGLAGSGGGGRCGVDERDPDQPLQPAADLAGPRPCPSRPCRMGRLRLGRSGSGCYGGGHDSGAAAGAEFGASRAGPLSEP